MPAKHRTNPIPDSITQVPGYPSKLTLYKNEASSYWQVRTYIDGKVVRRSTKTDNKRNAIEFAKSFYNDLLRRSADNEPLTSTPTFRAIALKMLDEMEVRVAEGEITEQTRKIAKLRLDREVFETLNKKNINAINYDSFQNFLQALSKGQRQLSSETTNAYLKLAKQVMSHAVKLGLISNIPKSRKIKVEANVRGFFNATEYRLLYRRARALEGKVFEERFVQGGTQIFEEGQSTEGRLLRKICITRELYELVIFMTNTFIRPTDIKNLQNKHIEVKNDSHRYLVLHLPPSKRKDKPIATMERAVEVYERHLKFNGENYKDEDGKPLNQKDDYFFFPQYKRDYALRQLQRQFAILLWSTGLKESVKGDLRTIYSLRHTCIMFRLLEGENIDYYTLAANARTSVEMIEKHYASQLTGEMNIDMIQSMRRR